MEEKTEIFFHKVPHFFKKSHLNTTEERSGGREVKCNSTLIFSKVGHEKTKPNRWVERNPKMRNIHSCHCLQKFSKYEKTSPSVFMRLKQSVSQYDVLQVGNWQFKAACSDFSNRVLNGILSLYMPESELLLEPKHIFTDPKIP